MNPIVKTVINGLLSQLNLVYKDDCLYYKLDLQYNQFEIFIWEGFDIIVKLLGLYKDFGQNTVADYHMLANCRLFNWKALKNVKSEIRPFLDEIQDFNYQSRHNTKNKIDPVKWLKNYAKWDIMGLLDMYIPEDFNLSSLRNKYNGYLVKDWLNIPKDCNFLSNFALEYTMNEFKRHVELNGEFVYYLHATDGKNIRSDFLNFIIKKDNFYQIFLKSDLPF